MYSSVRIKSKCLRGPEPLKRLNPAIWQTHLDLNWKEGRKDYTKLSLESIFHLTNLRLRNYQFFDKFKNLGKQTDPHDLHKIINIRIKNAAILRQRIEI
jgi:hypothetical protein